MTLPSSCANSAANDFANQSLLVLVQNVAHSMNRDRRPETDSDSITALKRASHLGDEPVGAASNDGSVLGAEVDDLIPLVSLTKQRMKARDARVRELSRKIDVQMYFARAISPTEKNAFAV